MEAFEFEKTKRRMCKTFQTCVHCRLDYTGYCSVPEKCRTDEQIERAIEVVEKWAKEHPEKTRQSEFLKIFPQAPLKRSCLQIKPCEIDPAYTFDNCLKQNCNYCRAKYWLAPLEELR